MLKILRLGREQNYFLLSTVPRVRVSSLTKTFVHIKTGNNNIKRTRILSILILHLLLVAALPYASAASAAADCTFKLNATSNATEAGIDVVAVDDDARIDGAIM